MGKRKLLLWLILLLVLSVPVCICVSILPPQIHTGLISALDDGEGPGTNFVKLEKVVEDQDWRIVVHWIKNRESLPGFAETYKPRADNYFLTVYVSFEHNPEFKKDTGAIKLEYKLDGYDQITFEAGHGNSEIFGNYGLGLIRDPDRNDPNDKRFNTQIYFEVPKKAQHLRFIVGSLPPLDLRD